MIRIIEPDAQSTHCCTDNFPNTDLYWDGPPQSMGLFPDHKKGEEPGVLRRTTEIGTIAQCVSCSRWWIVEKQPDRSNRYMWIAGDVIWREVNMKWYNFSDRKIRKRIADHF